jgi:hypothetical protein
MVAASADWNRTPEWCCRPLRPGPMRRREKVCHLARMQSRAETERRGVDGLLYVNRVPIGFLRLTTGSTQAHADRRYADHYGKHQSGDRRRQRRELPLARAVRARRTCDEECHGSSHSWRVSAPKSFSWETSFVVAIRVALLTKITHIPVRNGKGAKSAPQRPYP